MSKIQALRLNNFTGFSSIDLQFSAGINVFIGENGTGKTHLMKLMASLLKAHINKAGYNSMSKQSLEYEIANRLKGFFKPDKLGRLVKRNVGRQRAEVDFQVRGNSINFNFSTNSDAKINDLNDNLTNEIPSIYFPPREMLSTFEGFVPLYENREVSFDETYYHLAKSLSVPLAKGPRFKEAKELLEPLEETLGAKVRIQNNRFYLKTKDGKMEAPLVAEGYRKIASLMYLIANNELQENSILFWDEPEANLNPSLISTIVDILIILSGKGVQIFIASHDYLVTNLISLKSEYQSILPENEKTGIKFFGLQKGSNGIEHSEGATLADLDTNTILDEYLKFYDKEQFYFEQSQKDSLK